MRRQLAYATLLTGLCMLLGAVTLTLSGCAAVRQVLNIENPRYSLRDVRPRVDIALPLTASSIDLGLDIDVDNPNSVGIRLDQLDFDLLINGSQVLDSVSRDEVRIPANGIGTIHLQTRIGYQQLGNLARTLLEAVQGNRARYEVRGTAHYDTPLGRLSFPVTVYSSR